MLSTLFHSLLFAQAASAAVPLEQARLDVCLERARSDPTTAMSEASTWLGEANNAEASYPQQCLGYAYTLLLRWDAAERAFLSAREAELETNHLRRAQLAAMAGNAALAEGRADAALAALGLAAGDAAASGEAPLRSIVETDRARALVMQGSQAEAEPVLAAARALDGQNVLAWLLSATLARRLGNLDEAQRFIETAAALAPGDPETGLEAGVIAMLSGREEAAAASWRSVIAADSAGEAATTARGYLAQLAETPAE
jgi:tetratricopeptide (TPR) repeat protein